MSHSKQVTVDTFSSQAFSLVLIKLDLTTKPNMHQFMFVCFAWFGNEPGLFLQTQ